MNAKDLIDQLKQIAKDNDVSLKDLEVNYRFDFDSDVQEVNWICEDLRDQNNNKLVSVTLFADDNGL